MTDGKSAHIAVNDLGRMVFGLVYIYFWIKRTNWRSLLERYAAGFLVVSLFLLALEILLEVYGRQMAHGSSVALKVLFGVCLVIAMLGKYREWHDERSNFYFIGTARAIAASLIRPLDETDSALDSLLRIFHGNFEGSGVVNVTLALREPNSKLLRVTHRYPSEEVHRVTTFNHGEGGAGYAFKNEALVYIPWKELGHGVIQRLEEDDPYEMVTRLYFKPEDEAEKAYRSILSVPVLIFGQCYGALNVDSTSVNAFRKKHIQQAFYFATVVAQILQNRRTDAPSGPRGLRLTRK